MKFNVESSLYRITTLLSQFIFLNILYLICCLPIITIGTATSALFEVTTRYADQESGYLVKDFFFALKNSFKKGTIIFLFFLIPMTTLIFSSIFWFSLQTLLATVIGVLASLFSIYLFLSMLFGFSLIGRYDNNIRQIIKNALLLPVSNPLKSSGLLLIPLTMLCLSIVLNSFKLFLILFGFSFCAYCSGFLFLSIYSSHE